MAGQQANEREASPFTDLAMTAMQLRTVLTWVDMLQFDMAKQVLEAEGIPFDVFGWNINSLDDLASAFVSNHPSLRVREEDFERARALLDQTVGRGAVESER